MIFVMAEVLISKMLDVWKDAKESAEIFAEKEREEKEEERRRLYFPGNYTKLFIRWSGIILNMTGKITASCCSVV